MSEMTPKQEWLLAGVLVGVSAMQTLFRVLIAGISGAISRLESVTARARRAIEARLQGEDLARFRA